MTIQFQMGHDDHVAYLRHIWKTSPVVAKARGRMRIRIVTIYFVIAAGMLVIGASVGRAPVVWYSLAALWLVIGASTWRRLRPSVVDERELARLVKDKPSLGYMGKVILEMRDDGLHEQGESTVSHIGWAAMERLDEIESHVLIVLKGGNTMVIPRRAFTRVSDLDVFVARVREHLVVSN